MDKEDADLVELTNDMLRQLHVSKRVHSFSDINASVFVTLFEGLCGEQLPVYSYHPHPQFADIIRVNSRSVENDAHNVQSVIDTLSMDVLKASLSHISGEDVARGNRTAIQNLLQVFHGLLEYILETIDSEISTDAEEEKRLQDVNSDIALSDLDDPDRLTSDLIDDILEKELGVGYNHRRRADISNQSHGSIENTADLIRLGQTPMKTHVTVTNHLRARSAAKRLEHMDLPLVLHTDDRRLSYASSGGNVADVSSESHSVQPPPPPPPSSSIPAVWLDNSEECTTNGVLPGPLAPGSRDKLAPTRGTAARTWPEMKAHDLPVVGLASTAPTQVVREKSPVLDSSHSSSVTLPQRPPLGAENSTSSEFVGLGMRPRGLPGAVPDGQVDGRMSDGRRKPFTGPPPPPSHQTFTHHLYHHYDDGPAAKGVRQGPYLAASLPINFESGVRKKDQQHHIASGVTSAGDLLSTRHHSPPVRDGVCDQRTTDHTTSLPPDRSPAYEDLLSQLSRSMRSSGTNVSSRNTRVTSHIDRETEKHRASSQDTRPNAINRSRDRATNVQPDHSSQDKITSPGGHGDRANLKVSFLNGGHDESIQAGRSVDGHRYAGGDGLTTTGDAERPRVKRTHVERTKHSGSEISHNLDLTTEARNLTPNTFSEYLNKYYSDSRCDPHRDSRPGDSDDDSAEESYFSDGVVNYGHDRRQPGGFLAEMEHCLKRMKNKAKSVRFEDVLDEGATGDAGGVRRRLKQQDERHRMRTQMLDKVYRDELEAFDEDIQEVEKKKRQASHDKEKEFRQKVLMKKKPKRVPASSVMYSPKRGRSRVQNRARKRSASASPNIGRYLHDYSTVASTTTTSSTPTDVDGGGTLLTALLAEFPSLHLSSETLHDLWRQSARQVASLSRAERQVRSRKSKSQVEIEEAERRQKILLGVMKKELAHNQRMRDRKDRVRQQNSVRATLRDRRQQSARARRYYEQYLLQMRAKMMKKRTKEEQIFKKLFREGLDIQKDRIREMRQYVKDQRDQRAEKHHNEITSLENYYKDQFSILSESLAKEKNEMEVRESAQTKILDQMKSQLRRKMESEVRSFQQQMCRDEDDAFYRQLDADRLRQQLQMTRFHAHI